MPRESARSSLLLKVEASFIVAGWIICLAQYIWPLIS